MNPFSIHSSDHQDNHRNDSIHELDVVAPKQIHVRIHQPQALHFLVHDDGN